MTVCGLSSPIRCHSCESRNLKVYSNICLLVSGPLKRSLHKAGREGVKEIDLSTSLRVRFWQDLNDGDWIRRNRKAIHHYHCQSLIRFLVSPGMTVRDSIVPNTMSFLRKQESQYITASDQTCLFPTYFSIFAWPLNQCNEKTDRGFHKILYFRDSYVPLY